MRCPAMPDFRRAQGDKGDAGSEDTSKDKKDPVALQSGSERVRGCPKARSTLLLLAR